jgi:hypothetical protein
MAQTIEPFVGVVCVGGSLFQDSVCMNHLARDKVFADAEVLERALGLGPPELVGRHIDFAEAVRFFSDVAHRCFLRCL